ncbi:hypothetical protein IJ182_09090 [bacterium]|nr:hypothetical protein [bacterium]
MSNIFSYYTKYRENVGEYNKWNQDRNNIKIHPDISPCDIEKLKEKAKVISEPLLLVDSYEHEKAEDSETFFLTYNIELMSLATALSSLPLTITKLLPFLGKHADKNSVAQFAYNAIKKYKDKSITLLGKNIGLPKAATAAAAVLGGIFYAKGIKRSMQSQLGLIRKASFDATQNIIDNPNMFAILTPEQQEQVDKIVKDEEAHKTAFVERLKDKVNLSTSFQSVGDYRKNYALYLNKKDEYNQKQNIKSNAKLPNGVVNQAKEDKQLFENLIKNVEHDVLEPLRKVETVANISYSALFTGGFLEYLISDKFVQVLGVKNKVLSAGIKFGVPLLTYFLLNKNISDIENRAILATKHKHLKRFTENPEKYVNPQEEKKQSPIEFIKTLNNDIKEYDKFADTELPKIEEKLMAKKQIKLTPKQEKEAKLLQKNTSRVLNNQREKLYEQSVGIKALSETILGPLDILATATGGFIGNKMSKTCKNKKLASIMTGLGAVIAYIPAAIVEAKLTKQQKLAEKTSVMLALKDMQEISQFADKEIQIFPEFKQVKQSHRNIFSNFTK